mgnify:CR=1 FL=1
MKKQLSLSVFFITFFTCAGFLFLAPQNSRKVIDGMIQKRVEDVVTNVQHSVEAYNYSNFATIHIAASMPYIKDPKIPIKQKSEQLFGVKEADPNLIGLNITDLQGNSYLVEGPLYNFSERAYFKNALKGKETIFGPIYNKVTNIPTIFYGSPLYDENENLSNTFFLAARGENLSKFCNQNVIGNGGKTMIIRRSTGIVIADIESENVLKKNLYDDAAEMGIEELHDITTSIANGEKAVKIVTPKNYSGFVIGYTPISGTDWSVVAYTNYSDFQKPIVAQQRTLFLFAALMLLLSGLVSLIIWKKL